MQALGSLLAARRIAGILRFVPRFRARARLVGAIAIAVASAVTIAVAQPKKGGGPTPKKPPPVKVVDSGSEGPYDDTKGDTRPDGGVAMVVPEAGPVPPPVGATYGGDGGRASPLNPTPEEMPSGKLLGDAGTVDYDKLIGDIAALRARVSAVGDSMFRSRVAIAVETSGDHGKIARMLVSLDDGVVYTAPASFHADDMTQIYAGGVAAGRHAITVDIDRKDDRNDSFKTTQRSRFLVDVPRDQELAVEVKIWDDSSMGKDFPSDQSGKYDLRVRVNAKARTPGKK
jgi:hypothetical protein